MKPNPHPLPEHEKNRDDKRDISARERELLQWLADGMRSTQVAERLNKPVAAVRAHVARLLRQLRAATPAEALARLDRQDDADDSDDAQDEAQSSESLFEDGTTTEA
jgi:DNA-binding NarL/FixJ family response regulator